MVPQQRRRYRKPERPWREAVDRGKGSCGAGNHRRIEAEQQTAQRGHHRAPGQVRVKFHGFRTRCNWQRTIP